MTWLIVVCAFQSLWLLRLEIRLLRAQSAILETSETLDASDRWLGIGEHATEDAALDHWIAELASRAVEPLEKRLSALEPPPPAQPEEPWEAWLRETKARRLP